MNYFDENRLRDRAAECRKNMTTEELKLYFNFFKAEGIRVRRQYRIGSYLADFCVPEKKLVIELDGNEHFSYNGQEYDRQRDEFMKSKGYKVLRFENRQIRDRFEIVCEKIEKYLYK